MSVPARMERVGLAENDLHATPRVDRVVYEIDDLHEAGGTSELLRRAAGMVLIRFRQGRADAPRRTGRFDARSCLWPLDSPELRFRSHEPDLT